ncbi:hypothetical protein EIP86_009372 [Pleurotus ostreatoroseus]|nr:hypothetical protein EIP86_009372 [Pleurotus ostreatoroseus]
MDCDEDGNTLLMCQWHASDEHSLTTAESAVDDDDLHATMRDSTKFTEHVRRHIGQMTDTQIRKRLEDEFIEVANRLHERYSMVQQRLRDERAVRAVTKERISGADADGYDRFLNECRGFKSSSFATRLANSKNSKFVQLTSSAVRENGITTIANALKRNSIVSCVDCTKCSLDEVIKIIHSLRKAKSVTIMLPAALSVLPGFDESELDTSSEPDTGLVEALRQHKNILSLIPLYGRMSTTLKSIIIQNRKDARESGNDNAPLKLTYYEHLALSGTYAEGNPYLLFAECGRSRCTVLFTIPIVEISHGTGSGQLVLRLVHCRTAYDGMVKIKLNAVDIPWDEDKCPRDDFGVQDIVVPDDRLQTLLMPGVNELTITLRDDSGAIYWLRDVQLVWSKGGMHVPQVW